MELFVIEFVIGVALGNPKGWVVNGDKAGLSPQAKAFVPKEFPGFILLVQAL